VSVRYRADVDPFEAAALAVAGFVIGAYATAIGAGGGFLITPLLLIRHGATEPALVTTASLTVVAISTLTSTVRVAPERRTDYRLILAMAAVAVPGALFGAAGTSVVPRGVFTLGFAALIATVGLYLIWQPVTRQAEPVRRAWFRELHDREGNHFFYRVPVLRSIAPTVGFSSLAVLAGIGGGLLGVPVMTRVMRVPHSIAIPSMHLLVALMSVSAVALHLLLGHASDTMSDVPWLGVGVVVANPLGQYLRRRLGEGQLMRMLAAGLLLVAARTAWGAF
jgi:uncharacterized membrane protein YfcA